MNTTIRSAVILLGLSLSACGPRDHTVAIAESRQPTHTDVKPGLSSRQRFGDPFEESGAGGAGAASQGGEPFGYVMPPGWTKGPAKQFRDISLEAPGGVECWVSVLPARADALAHLARWHNQMGLPEPTQSDVAALPQVPLLGGVAYRVDRSSPDGQKRMVGSMLLAPMRHVFVKMQGSPAAVEAQLPALSAFEASLGMGGAATTQAPSGTGTTGGATEAAKDAPIRWTTPPGWSDLGPGNMKVVEFSTPDGARAWLTLLEGDGGGLIPNLTRWCGQTGHAVMSNAEIDALSRWTVLGRPSIYVPLFAEGTATGLLGVIVPLQTTSLFIKMSGPSDVLHAREAEFRVLCEGLKQ